MINKTRGKKKKNKRNRKQLLCHASQTKEWTHKAPQAIDYTCIYNLYTYV